MVIATQNPVEHHGTYPLPESQLDRFLMRLRIGYPDAAERARDPAQLRTRAAPSRRRPAWSPKTSCTCRTRCTASPSRRRSSTTCSPSWSARATHESLALGVSPRGSQALYRAVQALALVEGRDYAIPDDVKRLAAPLFAHRVVINTRTTLVQRRADMGERIIEEILSQVEVPL